MQLGFYSSCCVFSIDLKSEENLKPQNGAKDGLSFAVEVNLVSSHKLAESKSSLIDLRGCFSDEILIPLDEDNQQPFTTPTASEDRRSESFLNLQIHS